MSKRANANEEAKAIQSTFDLLNKPNAQKDLLDSDIAAFMKKEPAPQSVKST
jgi:hypothetical protein